ncbi:Homologous-pairing-like protein 2 [Lamellibrachia satsuma]|nr:Homologous-pairing-like protein 2 [Lamellibrachia satsuma]
MSKSKDAAVGPAVLAYLVKQNRPYSAIDIHSNLHKAYGKTAVIKALETLAEQGKVKEKTYGKQKVYVADQSHFPTVDDAELKTMDAKIAKLTQKLRVTDDKHKRLETELRDLSSSLTTTEARKQLTELTQQCQQLDEKLNRVKSNENSVSPEDRLKAIHLLIRPFFRPFFCLSFLLSIHVLVRLSFLPSILLSVLPYFPLSWTARTKYVKEWKKRKRMANDILDAILEGYPKKKKDLYEDIGIETDDDLKVSVPEL